MEQFIDPGSGTWVQESGVSIFTGSINALGGTATALSNSARIEFNAFYISADLKTECALGKYYWISGEIDQIALMKDWSAEFCGLLKAANSRWVQKFFKLSWVKAVTDYLKKNIAREVARGQATVIDPKTELAKAQETRISGNVDAKITENTNFVHFGKAGTTLSSEDIELQHTLLGGPGQETEIRLVNFDYLESATYRDTLQSIPDGLFGLGIAVLRENLDDDPESVDYGMVSFTRLHEGWEKDPCRDQSLPTVYQSRRPVQLCLRPGL